MDLALIVRILEKIGKKCLGRGSSMVYSWDHFKLWLSHFGWSSLGFERLYIPALHFSEHHFCLITKVSRPLHQKFEKKCLGTSWIIKSIFFVSL